MTVQIVAHTADHPCAWRRILAVVAPDAAGVLRSTSGGQTLKEIAAVHRCDVRLMSLSQWREERIAAQLPPVSWEPTTHARYAYGLDVLPPVAWADGAFLVGEEADHCVVTGRPMFHGYRARGTYYDATSRPVTIAELEANRSTPRGQAWVVPVETTPNDGGTR